MANGDYPNRTGPNSVDIYTNTDPKGRGTNLQPIVDSNGMFIISPLSVITASLGVTGISDGRQVVTTAGTRVQLSALAIKAVIITSETDNTDIVVVGGATCVAALATRRGTPLYPGDSVVVVTDDLSDIYIDSVVNGEGVTYTLLT